MTKRSVSLTRREFLRNSGALAAGLAVGQANIHKAGVIARQPLKIDSLEKFVDPLPIPSVIRPKGKRPNPERSGSLVPYYRLAMRQIESKIHRDVKAARLW